MAHGDDRGLRLPPRVAPVQAVVLAVKDETIDAARRLVADLKAAGVRARVDDRTNLGFGRRAVDWELKGVPVRLEVGPRDLEAGQATLVRRDREGKQPLALDGAAAAVAALLEEIQTSMLTEARQRRDDATTEVS